jgi:hypothetical protein
MGDERAVLSPVQDGGIWLVQITAPTGEKSYVGKFLLRMMLSSGCIAIPGG